MLDQQTIDNLVNQAAEARQLAYVPYSNFAVGAALLAGSGKIYQGCNVENASYGLSVCAERVAIWKAVSAGETEFKALAVVTAGGVSPCGACRQVMAEFATEMPVIIANQNAIRQIIQVSDLLPFSFLPEHLIED